MIEYKCEICNEIYLTLDEPYVQENPNGSELAIEQALRRHNVQHEECWIDITCPECGQVVESYPPDYWEEYPNSADIAAAESLERHYREDCPVVAEVEWAEWKKSVQKVLGEHFRKEMTPRQIVRFLNQKWGWSAKTIWEALEVPPDRTPAGDTFFDWEGEIYDMCGEERPA